MGDKATFYQRNRETMLSRAKQYYENTKERLRKKSRNKYRELSNEEKIKREYGRNRYQNMSKENKETHKEHQNNYCEAKNSKFLLSFLLHIV